VCYRTDRWCSCTKTLYGRNFRVSIFW
jgi:hypothetical protein